MKTLLTLCVVAAIAVAGNTAPAAEPTSDVGVITASPSHVRFGSVAIGETKGPISVTLTSAACCSTWVRDIVTDFPAGSGFRVESSCPSDETADLLDPGENCTVNVSMTGETKGHYRGTVTVLWGCCHGIPDTVIKLSGTTTRTG